MMLGKITYKILALNIKSDDDENLDTQTKIFIDNNYQSLVDDLPDIKPDIKADIILEDVLHADTIDYISDIEFVKEVPQQLRDRLKRKIKRKKIKKERNKSKKMQTKNKHSKNNKKHF